MKNHLVDTSGDIWKPEFDETLCQTYYVNLQNGAVSFDLASEVLHKSDPGSKKNDGLLSSLRRKHSSDSNKSVQSNTNTRKKYSISRLGTLFLKNRSRDNNYKDGYDFTSSNSFEDKQQKDDTKKRRNSSEKSPSFANANRFDDEYLLSNPDNFKNFAGTSLAFYDSDTESQDSSESIQSYSVSEYELGYDLDYGRQEERKELREQLLRQLHS